MTIFVDEGDHADTTYQLTSNGPIAVGTSDINFTIFGRVESITVSEPLVRTGNNISLDSYGVLPSHMQQFPAGTILGNAGTSIAEATYLTALDVKQFLGLDKILSEDYVVVTGTTESLVADKAYRPTSIAITSFSLPVTCPEGAVISIEGSGSGGWEVLQGANQSVIFGDKVSTVGVSGKVASMHERDVVKLRCIEADTTFQVINAIGNIDII
jgi:hypothetical protein